MFSCTVKLCIVLHCCNTFLKDCCLLLPVMSQWISGENLVLLGLPPLFSVMQQHTEMGSALLHFSPLPPRLRFLTNSFNISCPSIFWCTGGVNYQGQSEKHQWDTSSSPCFYCGLNIHQDHCGCKDFSGGNLLVCWDTDARKI